MKYNYIIVGAGTAGCVLASRLSKDLGAKVLLLETGKKDINPFIHIPAGYQFLMQNKNITKQYITEPVKNLNGRRVEWPRGEVLGGCSSVNGMVHLRGTELDFDSWEKAGNKGWGWKDILPLYIKSECSEIADREWHGLDGPIKVSKIKRRHKICELFIKGCQEYGIPLNKDFNGAERFGVGYLQLACSDGKRFSTSTGYLSKIHKKKNLKVLTSALVTKILFENNRAVGVSYFKDGVEKKAWADQEIILSAGAINTPKILQLSGVGPKGLLMAHGIDVVHELPGVGENLQDHLQVSSVYKIKNSTTFNDINSSLLQKIYAVVEFILTRKGVLSEGATHVGLFTKSNRDVVTPDLQYLLTLASGDLLERKLDKFSGITLGFYQNKPKSRGAVKINSKSAMEDPLIFPNYLDHEEDKKVVIEGLKLSRFIMKTTAMKEVIKSEYLPGGTVRNDAELLEYAQNVGKTNYHPSGSCKMGDDVLSVVDSNLKVKGVSSLRIADASIMPSIVSSNINATVIMIGEKAYNLISNDFNNTN